MKNFFRNNKDLTRSLYTLGIIIVAIVFYRITENVQINNFLPVIIDVMYPFIGGAIIAYLLNCGTRFIEHRVLIRIKYFQSSEKKVQKQMRMISITIAAVFLLGIIIAIISYIIPEIIMSAQNVINFVGKINYYTLRRYASNIFQRYPIVLDSTVYR